MLEVLLALFISVFLIWVVSLIKRDAGIIDSFWGLFFLLSAFVYQSQATIKPGLGVLILALMVTIWSLRLSIYIFKRNWKKTEDFRYKEMRDKYGSSWPFKSFFYVFLLQGALAFVIGLPFWSAFAAAKQELGQGWVIAGTLLWFIGFLFEAIADAQLARFKKRKRNRGKVMNQGLWRYSRHPNYFGEAVLWWGYGCFGLAGGHPWTLVGPLLMTFLLLKVSGVTLLEKALAERKAGYESYMATTSAFFPLPPKKIADHS